MNANNTSPPDFFAESEAYELFMGRWTARLAPSFVEFSGVREGEVVLDACSGTGGLTLALAAIASVRVTGVDRSPAYVRYAQARTRDERVRFQVGDVQALDSPGAAFDRAVSMIALNFVPDREMAVREMVRVTKGGGIVAAAVWDYDEGMEMLRVFWDEAAALDVAAAARDERHMPLCTRGELTALWEATGLQVVEERPLVAELSFSSFADYWEPFLGGQGPAGAHTLSLPQQERTMLEDRLRRRLLGSHQDGPVTMQARAWAVKGIVPDR